MAGSLTSRPIADRLVKMIHQLESEGHTIHAVWLGAQVRRDLAEETFNATGNDMVDQSFLGRKILLDFYDRNKMTLVVDVPYYAEDTHGEPGA